MHSQSTHYGRGGAGDAPSSSRYGGNNGNSFHRGGSGSGYQGNSYYQRPMQYPSQMMSARPLITREAPQHQGGDRQQQHQAEFNRRAVAEGGAAFRGARSGFLGAGRGGYSRPEVASRNEEMRGGRFDNRTQQQAERSRFSRNFEEAQSVEARPAAKREREPQPEISHRPQT